MKGITYRIHLASDIYRVKGGNPESLLRDSLDCLMNFVWNSSDCWPSSTPCYIWLDTLHASLGDAVKANPGNLSSKPIFNSPSKTFPFLLVR